MDWRRLRNNSIKAVGAAGLTYVTILGAFYLLQDSLLFSGPTAGQVRQNDGIGRISRYRLSVDNALLQGWFINSATESTKGIVIYFGGNAENIDSVFYMARKINNVHIASMHYRGYGLSTGKPSEQALYADALAIYDDLKQKYPTLPIAVVGRSLGTGIATYLAANRSVQSVGLFTPYDSIESVAKRHYRWLPVKYLLKHKFDSVRNAKHIQAPTHIVFAENDSLIPKEHALRLLDAIRGQKTWHLLPNVGHNDIQDSTEYNNILVNIVSDLSSS